MENSAGATDALVNVIASYKNRVWSVIIFFRSKQRPTLYYAPETQKILVSPGCVEMGGQIITGREADFSKITPELIEETYADISLKQIVFLGENCFLLCLK